MIIGGLGIVVWCFWFGYCGPIPNPQSPIPNPQSPNIVLYMFNIYLIKLKKNFITRNK